MLKYTGTISWKEFWDPKSILFVWAYQDDPGDHLMTVEVMQPTQPADNTQARLLLIPTQTKNIKVRVRKWKHYCDDLIKV